MLLKFAFPLVMCSIGIEMQPYDDDAKKDFFRMLKKKDVDCSLPWVEAKTIVENLMHYKAVESTLLREKYFKQYCGIEVDGQRRRFSLLQNALKKKGKNKKGKGNTKKGKGKGKKKKDKNKKGKGKNGRKGKKKGRREEMDEDVSDEETFSDFDNEEDPELKAIATHAAQTYLTDAKVDKITSFSTRFTTKGVKIDIIFEVSQGSDEFRCMAHLHTCKLPNLLELGCEYSDLRLDCAPE